MWQFASVSSTDAQKLLTLGLSCMNAAFSMVINSYGGAQSGSAAHGSTVVTPAALQPIVPQGAPPIGTSGSISASPSQSDIDYQSALMVVADAIWVQKRIIKILIEDPSSPQTVS